MVMQVEKMPVPGEISSSEVKDIILNEDIGATAGAAERFDSNLAAIRLVKQLESEGRRATPVEQHVLARYSGFGDSAFNYAFPIKEEDDWQHHWQRDAPPAWKRRHEELKSLVREDEYEAIGKSRVNAFYTTPEVVQSMWKALERMGVNNIAHPRILEPSAGNGRFLGFQPKEMAARSQRTAVELDKITGQVLKNLYPESEVYAGTGYEAAPIRKESVDIAISNVPFGQIAIFDPNIGKGRHFLTKQIHNYFFAKTLDNLRPGGVLAFITSCETLNAKSHKNIREALAEKGDLIGAFRLPKEAFPDTEVVTDVIFMKKRQPGEAPGDQSWLDTTTIEAPTFEKVGHYNHDTGAIDTVDGTAEVDINNYYLEHPEMVLGTNSATGTMHGKHEYAVEKNKSEPLSVSLDRAVSHLPQDIIKDAPHTDIPLAYISKKDAALAGARSEGAYVLNDKNELNIVSRGTLKKPNIDSFEERRVRQMMEVRDAARNVLNLQLTDAPDDELAVAQDKLSGIYKKFTFENGALTNRNNAALMVDDPDGPFLRALEVDEKRFDPEKEADRIKSIKDIKKAKTLTADDVDKIKMPFFSHRVVHGLADKQEARDESDALAVSLNETGRIDFKRMADLLGKSEKEIENTLSERGGIYKNPLGDWEPADKYLSGDVRQKLKTALVAANANPAYKANVDALKAVQPTDLNPSEIGAQLGANWIPEKDVNAFIRKLLEIREDYSGNSSEFYHYSKATNDWVMENKPFAASSLTESKYGLRYNKGETRMTAIEIIDRLLNGKTIEVEDDTGEKTAGGNPIKKRNDQATFAAQAKAAEIQKQFQEYIWGDAERSKRLSQIYNEKFNTNHIRDYNGSHQALPGMAEGWYSQLHKHQRDAIWRGVQDRTVLLDHEVGFGKTAVMVAAGMELRRLGLSQKNLYVVPKATYKQFKDQFLDVYPYAKVLSPVGDDFDKQNRPEFVSRAITGDWDAIILSYEQFKKIPVRPETSAEYIRSEIKDLEDALEEEEKLGLIESQSFKDLQAKKMNAETRLKERERKAGLESDKTVHFEDLGIDQLFVDEAHNFKNLRFITHKSRVKGLPNSASERADDMYEKVRYLQGKGKSGGVVFATGTPVANTIAETFTMQRYLQPQMLEAKDIKHFDAWAATFGQMKEGIEQSPTGKYRMAERFIRFKNVPELSALWQETADIRVADEVPEMLKVRPRIVNEKGEAGKRIVVACPANKQLLDYMQAIQKRADDILSGKVRPDEDNMLKVSNDARLAAMDIGMKVKGGFNPQGKIQIAAENIRRVYDKTTEGKTGGDKGVQLVFLDIGTPKATDKLEDEDSSKAHDEEINTEEEASLITDEYAKLKAELMSKGIPEKEIAFIHSATTDSKKTQMFKDVNDGKIRVVIGSTAKLGTGVNVQYRAAALHHLDCPWRPCDLEQREGRIIRQGNKVYGPEIDKKTGDVIDLGQGVEIYTYVTNPSFDAYMWQAVEGKVVPIKAINRRQRPPREIEDVDAFTMSAGEAKAIASGNPDVIKAVKLKNDVQHYQWAAAAHMDEQVRAKAQLQNIPGVINSIRKDIEDAKRDEILLQKTKGDKFSITIDSITYNEGTKAKAEDALKNAIKYTEGNRVIGKYRGFDMTTFNMGGAGGYKVVLSNPESGSKHETTAMEYEYDKAKDPITGPGAMRRIDNALNNIGRNADVFQFNLKRVQNDLEGYQKIAGQPFPEQAELDRAQAELKVLDERLLGLHRGEESAQAEHVGQYYIERGNGEYEEVFNAEPLKVPGHEGVSLFLHKDSDGNWVVKEQNTGAVFVSWSTSKQNAIERANAYLERHTDTELKELIQKKINEGHKTPFYEASLNKVSATENPENTFEHEEAGPNDVIVQTEVPKAAMPAPEPSHVLEPEVKQPYQMTDAEFAKSMYSPLHSEADVDAAAPDYIDRVTSGVSKMGIAELTESARKSAKIKQDAILGAIHEAKKVFVEGAIRQGKTIPPSVLADFPGIKEDIEKQKEADKQEAIAKTLREDEAKKAEAEAQTLASRQSLADLLVKAAKGKQTEAEKLSEFKPAEIIEKPIEKPAPVIEQVSPQPVKHVETDAELKARIFKEQFPGHVPYVKPMDENEKARTVPVVSGLPDKAALTSMVIQSRESGKFYLSDITDDIAKHLAIELTPDLRRALSHSVYEVTEELDKDQPSLADQITKHVIFESAKPTPAPSAPQPTPNAVESATTAIEAKAVSFPPLLEQVLTLKETGGKSPVRDYEKIEEEAHKARIEGFKKQAEVEIPPEAVKLAEVKAEVEAQGLTVKEVPESKLHDYEGMNPEAAKSMGVPIEKNTIEIAKDMPDKDKVDTIRHEVVEMSEMEKGKPYWQAHETALKEEGKDKPLPVVAKEGETMPTKTEKERTKRPNGYLEPIEGDKVTQMVAGPFGSPAYINGEVKKNKKGELIIEVSGSSSYMGIGAGPKSGKKYALSGAWVVDGDPEIKRREDKRKADFEESERPWREREARRKTARDNYQVPVPELHKGDKLKDMATGETVIVGHVNRVGEKDSFLGGDAVIKEDQIYTVSEKEATELYGGNIPDGAGGYAGGDGGMLRGYTKIKEAEHGLVIPKTESKLPESKSSEVKIKNKEMAWTSPIAGILTITDGPAKGKYPISVDAPTKNIAGTGMVVEVGRINGKMFFVKMDEIGEFHQRQNAAAASKFHPDPLAELQKKRRALTLEISGAYAEADHAKNHSYESGEGTGQWVFAGEKWEAKAKEAQKRLAEFDAAHPEVIAKIKADEEDDREWRRPEPVKEAPIAETPKIAPTSEQGKELLEAGKFPARDEALKTLESPKVAEVHDDGDLTVKNKEGEHIVTTEGKVFSEKPKRTKKQSQFPLAELQRIQAERTPRAKAMDTSKLHKQVISPISPRVADWIKHPGKYDIQRIDTPKGQHNVTVKTPKSRGVGAGNGLKSEKHGRIYLTRMGRGKVASRKPIGKRSGKGK